MPRAVADARPLWRAVGIGVSLAGCSAILDLGGYHAGSDADASVLDGAGSDDSTTGSGGDGASSSAGDEAPSGAGDEAAPSAGGDGASLGGGSSSGGPLGGAGMDGSPPSVDGGAAEGGPAEGGTTSTDGAADAGGPSSDAGAGDGPNPRLDAGLDADDGAASGPDAAGPPACAPGLLDKMTACTAADPTCVKGCGPRLGAGRRGAKSCSCNTGTKVFNCVDCAYPSPLPACYAPPAVVAACTADVVDGMTCAAPCGSLCSLVNGGKTEGCVCVALSSGATVWTCATQWW